MEVTIMNVDLQTKRICQNCGEPLVKGNAKRKFCSDNCKTDSFRKKQIQTAQLNEQMVKQKEDRIQELESRPVKRTSSVRVINQAWQLASQAYTVQAKICLQLKNQLKELELEEGKMKSGSRGAFYGAAIGVGFVLFLIATLYDARQGKKLGTAFFVGSLFMLMVVGIVSYWIGKKCHTYFQSSKENINNEIVKNNLKSDELKKQLNAEQQSLIKLQYELGQLNQYESEVITSVDDIHL